MLLMPIAFWDWGFIGRCLRMRPKGDGGASFVSHCGQDDIFGDTTPSWLSEVDARMGRRGGNRGAAPICRGHHVIIFPERLSPFPRYPRDERMLTTSCGRRLPLPTARSNRCRLVVALFSRG